MTAVLAAAVIVSWAALIVLALGYAQIVGQLKELSSRGTTAGSAVFPDLAAPSAAVRTLALTLTTTCDTCSAAFEEWRTLAGRLTAAGHRTLVISVDNTDVWTARGGADVHLASGLSAPLLLAYQPALVEFAHTGALVAAEPLGSAAGLRDACERFLQSSKETVS